MKQPVTTEKRVGARARGRKGKLELPTPKPQMGSGQERKARHRQKYRRDILRLLGNLFDAFYFTRFECFQEYFKIVSPQFRLLSESFPA